MRKLGFLCLGIEMKKWIVEKMDFGSKNENEIVRK